MVRKALLSLIVFFLVSLVSVNVSALCIEEDIPTSSCKGGLSDITVSGRYYLDAGEMLQCLGNLMNVNLEVVLWEDDIIIDDFIVGAAGSFHAVELPTPCEYVDYTHTFEDVKLSDWSGGFEGNTIEVYAELTVEGTERCAISPINVDIFIGQCSAGTCCDLSTCTLRPSNYKCQEDINLDYGCPTGTSLGDDVYSRYEDRYCSGSGSACAGDLEWDPWAVYDTCNSNEVCVDDNENCQNVACNSASECETNGWVGSPICDPDDVYQDYRTYTCTNPGTASASCGFSDTSQLKQDCAETCDAGACVGIECYTNNDCGTNNYVGSPDCNVDNVWQNYRIYACSNPGTASASCGNSDTYQLKQSCAYGCSAGSCIGCTPNDHDSCWNNDVYWYDSCDIREDKKQECGITGYVGNNYCSTGDVYRDYETKGCSASSCTSSTESIKQEDCGGSGCTLDSCNIVEEEGYLWTGCGSFDNTIYKLNTSGGVISSFSSPGNWPWGLTWDGTYLWNVDYDEEKIYKLTVNGDVVESFNSPGTLPTGITWDGTNLWTADLASSKIYKLTTEGNVLDEFSSPAANPSDLTFDGTNLWNVIGATVYKLTTAGVVIDSIPSSGDEGLTFDGTYLWNLDGDSDQIHKLNPADGSVLETISAPCSWGYGLAWQPITDIACNNAAECGANGWVNLASCNVDDVWQDTRTYSCMNAGTTDSYCDFSDTNQLKETCADTCAGGICAILEEGYLWHTDALINTIYKLDTSGAVIDSFASPGTGPWGLAWDGQYLWHSDYNSDFIYKLTINGTVVESFDPGIHPEDLAWDGQYLWVVDTIDEKVYKLTTDGTVIDNFVPPPDEWGAAGITWDGGYLWHTNYLGPAKTYKLTTDGTIVDTIDYPGGTPSSLTWDKAYFWSNDDGFDQILKIAANGSIIDSFASPGSDPYGLAWQSKEEVSCSSNAECGAEGWANSPSCNSGDVYQDYRNYICKNSGTTASYCDFSDNNQLKQTCIDGCMNGTCVEGYLWNADMGTNTIYKILTNGTIVDSFSTSVAGGLTWDGVYFWVIDNDGNWIINKITTDGTVVDSFNCPAGGGSGLTWDGTNLWHSDSAIDKIYKLSANGSVLSEFASPGFEKDMAWDGTNLWLADASGNQIYKLNPADGSVLNNYPASPGSGPSGLTFDGEFLWYTGGSTDKIYKMTTDGITLGSFDSPGNSPSGLTWRAVDDIVCSSNSECGISAWLGTPSCNVDNVWQDYGAWTCNNAGTQTSSCLYLETPQLKQTCSDTCSAGSCVEIECSSNAECGTDGYIGITSCNDDDVYQDNRTYTCTDPGLTNSSCSYSDNYQLEENCAGSCSNGVCTALCDSTSYTTGGSAYGMSDGVTKANMCGAEQFYKITLAQTCDVSWTMTPEVDYDLYSLENSSYPDDDTWDCRPYEEGAISEACFHNSLAPGDYYARVKLGSGLGSYSILADVSSCGCTSHDHYGCVGSNVSWYDSCNNQEEVRDDCGVDYYVGDNYCVGDDVFRAKNITGCSIDSCTSTMVGEFQVTCGASGCFNGSCVTCISHDHYSCVGDDVYWYDSCNNQEEVKEDCGALGCFEGSCVTCTSHDHYSCVGGNVHWYDSCNNQEEVRDDCGTSGYVSGNYCLTDDVYRDYDTKGCNITTCTSSVSPVLQSDCGTSGYVSGNYCLTNDVYRDYDTRECNLGSCTSSTDPLKQTECGASGCLAGSCNVCIPSYSCTAWSPSICPRFINGIYFGEQMRTCTDILCGTGSKTEKRIC